MYLFHVSLLFTVRLCVACHEGQAEQSKLQFDAALSVYKHSALTPQTSGFCSKFLSAHAEQLSNRETLAPGRSKCDPEYPARQGTETDPVLEIQRPTPYQDHSMGESLFSCFKIPT